MEGTLRLAYWKGNDVLKGTPISSGVMSTEGMQVNGSQGFVAEGTVLHTAPDVRSLGSTAELHCSRSTFAARKATTQSSIVLALDTAVSHNIILYLGKIPCSSKALCTRLFACLRYS